MTLSVTSKIWDGSWLDSPTQQIGCRGSNNPWIPPFPGNAAPHGQTPHGIQSALFSITKWVNVWPCRGADCPRPSRWKHVGLENTFHIFSSTTQRKGIHCWTGSPPKQSRPHLSDSSPQRSAVWLGTGWARLTSYDNKQSQSRQSEGETSVTSDVPLFRPCLQLKVQQKKNEETDLTTDRYEEANTSALTNQIEMALFLCVLKRWNWCDARRGE